MLASRIQSRPVSRVSIAKAPSAPRRVAARATASVEEVNIVISIGYSTPAAADEQHDRPYLFSLPLADCQQAQDAHSLGGC